MRDTPDAHNAFRTYDKKEHDDLLAKVSAKTADARDYKRLAEIQVC